MQTRALIEYLNGFLNVSLFRDYAPNGLQVEGRQEIRRILLGVSASQALVDRACSVGADCLLVHHGWFWKGERPEVTGMKRRRLAALLAHDVNLIAYHLPLDAHPEVGNNAEIARLMGFMTERRTGHMDLLNIGVPEGGTVGFESLMTRLASVTERTPQIYGAPAPAEVSRVAWCSGAAQDSLLEAAEAGAQVYISGEVSERTVYEARENGMVYVAAGHHATERFGIQALGRHLCEQFPELSVSFCDDDNAV